MLQASIHFEKAAILFNIAAIASQLAVATDRTSDAGVKEAARLFQVTLPPDVEPEMVDGCCVLGDTDVRTH
jgi:programmed cell death 6-interacting protein